MKSSFGSGPGATGGQGCQPRKMTDADLAEQLAGFSLGPVPLAQGPVAAPIQAVTLKRLDVMPEGRGSKRQRREPSREPSPFKLDIDPEVASLTGAQIQKGSLVEGARASSSLKPAASPDIFSPEFKTEGRSLFSNPSDAPYLFAPAIRGKGRGASNSRGRSAL